MEITNQTPSELKQKLTKVAGAFMFNDKLQRISTGPLLIPHDLNTINTKFNGPSGLGEEESTALNSLISKYIPGEINRDTVLTTEGVSGLRKISLLVNLADDLKGQDGLNFVRFIQEVDDKLLNSELNALVSSEEMYRIRNHKMDPNVANFPAGIIEKNPQLRLEPAYDKFVGSIKSGKTLEEAITSLKTEYGDEHTKVTFEPAQVSGLKPVYGMNGI